MSTRRRFWLKKLHSITGVIPVGAFFATHMITQGSSNATASGAGLESMTPWRVGLQSSLVLAPLAFHGLYGVALAMESRPTVGSYPTSRNWMHLAQRVTGVFAAVFIGWHVWELWIPQVTGALAARDLGTALTARLSSTHLGVPVVALAYLFGIAACALHFANGLWGFVLSWGVAVTHRSQRRLALGFAVLGALLFVLGADATVQYATGAGLFGAESRPFTEASE